MLTIFEIFAFKLCSVVFFFLRLLLENHHLPICHLVEVLQLFQKSYVWLYFYVHKSKVIAQ